MRMVVLALGILGMMAGCTPDDVKGGDSADSADPAGDDGADGSEGADGTDGSDGADGSDGGAQPAIVGTWLSEGDDIAPVLRIAPASYVSITATFDADDSYIVLAEKNNGDVDELTGTFTTDEGPSPATIVLSQTTPYEATAEGIWQVEGSTLTYEVVQTDPPTEPVSCTPPTPESGFGKTTCSVPVDEGVFTQVFQAQ